MPELLGCVLAAALACGLEWLAVENTDPLWGYERRLQRCDESEVESVGACEWIPERYVAWFGDVEIPAELVDAQREGELVLFVGAGVSIGPHQACLAFAYSQRPSETKANLGEFSDRLLTNRSMRFWEESTTTMTSTCIFEWHKY